jgi:hypothetical protein
LAIKTIQQAWNALALSFLFFLWLSRINFPQSRIGKITAQEKEEEKVLSSLYGGSLNLNLVLQAVIRRQRVL